MLDRIETQQNKRTNRIKYNVLGFNDRNNYSKLISDQNIYRNEEK